MSRLEPLRYLLDRQKLHTASCTFSLAHRGEIFRSLADAVLRDGERGDVRLAGCDRYAQGRSYRDEHEASSRSAEMTGLRRLHLERTPARLYEMSE